MKRIPDMVLMGIPIGSTPVVQRLHALVTRAERVADGQADARVEPVERVEAGVGREGTGHAAARSDGRTA